MKPWSDRTDRSEELQSIKQRLNQQLSKLPQGAAISFSPPAIPGVGTSGGFTFVLEDRGGNDIPYLAANVDKFLAAARKRPEIAGINTSFLPSVPQEFVEVDRDKALKQGVAISDVYTSLQAFMGGIFVNSCNRFGRQWQVYVQADGNNADPQLKLHRSSTSATTPEQAVPLSALTKFEPRFGLNTSCTITSTPRPRSTATPRPAIAPTRRWQPSNKCSRKPCRRTWVMTTWACRFSRSWRSEACHP